VHRSDGRNVSAQFTRITVHNTSLQTGTLAASCMVQHKLARLLRLRKNAETRKPASCGT
jgi:hypothetical protein